MEKASFIAGHFSCKGADPDGCQREGAWAKLMKGGERYRLSVKECISCWNESYSIRNTVNNAVIVMSCGRW